MAYNSNAEVAKAIESSTVAMYNAQHDLFRILTSIQTYHDDMIGWLSKEREQQEILYEYMMAMPRAFYLVAGTPAYRELRKALKRTIQCLKNETNPYLTEMQKDSYLRHTMAFLQHSAGLLEMEEIAQEKIEYKDYKHIVNKFAPEVHSPMARAFSRVIGHRAREDEERIRITQEADANANGTQNPDTF